MNKIKVLVPLDAVLPNPWQPRESEDEEHIRSLAISIYEDGLLQEPLGRLVSAAGSSHSLEQVHYGGNYALRAVTAQMDPKFTWMNVFAGFGLSVELAFGHSRLAAFRHLRKVNEKSDIYSDWQLIPVIIRDMGDEEMFRFAITENMQRKNLNAIEEAKAMAAYRDSFEKTSAEIGELFGLSDSAVRNKLRLLDLPDYVQGLLKRKSITEGVGRALIGLYKIPESKRNDATQEVDRILMRAEQGATPSQIADDVECLRAQIDPQPKQLSVLEMPTITPSEPVTLPKEVSKFETVEDEAEEESELSPVESMLQNMEAVEPDEEAEPAPVVEEAVQEPEPEPVPEPAAVSTETVEPPKAESTDPAPVETSKAKTWDESKIHLNLSFWPDDGNLLGRNVTIGIQVNDGIPKIRTMREVNLALPESIKKIMDGAKMEVEG